MLSAGCLQLFAVSQSFPGPRSVKLGPAAVVLIVTLMRTPREVGDAVRRDQQVAGNRGSVRTSFRQSVLAEFAVHVAQFAECHVVYGDVLSGALDPDRSLQRRSLDAATNIRSCRISRAISSMMWPCRGGYCLDEEPRLATRRGLTRPVTADRTKVVLKVVSIDGVTLTSIFRFPDLLA